MQSKLPSEDLDHETLNKLGIKILPDLSEVGSDLLVMGRIFSALKGLDDEQALNVLQRAQIYLINRKNAPDIDNVQMPDLAPTNSYAPPIDWTLQITARVYQIKTMELKLRNRDVLTAEARHVAIYVLRMASNYTLREIGNAIGGRTPATVSHGFEHIASKLDSDKSLKARVEEIQTLIGVK